MHVDISSKLLEVKLEALPQEHWPRCAVGCTPRTFGAVRPLFPTFFFVASSEAVDELASEAARL